MHDLYFLSSREPKKDTGFCTRYCVCRHNSCLISTTLSALFNMTQYLFMTCTNLLPSDKIFHSLLFSWHHYSLYSYHCMLANSSSQLIQHSIPFPLSQFRNTIVAFPALSLSLSVAAVLPVSNARVRQHRHSLITFTGKLHDNLIHISKT